jgi:hypothetical protein
MAVLYHRCQEQNGSDGSLPDPIYGEHEDIPRGPKALSGYLHVRHKLDPPSLSST